MEILIDLIGHGAAMGAVITGFAIVFLQALESIRLGFGGDDDDEDT